MGFGSIWVWLLRKRRLCEKILGLVFLGFTLFFTGLVSADDKWEISSDEIKRIEVSSEKDIVASLIELVPEKKQLRVATGLSYILLLRISSELVGSDETYCELVGSDETY